MIDIKGHIKFKIYIEIKHIKTYIGLLKTAIKTPRTKGKACIYICKRLIILHAKLIKDVIRWLFAK